MQRRPCVLHLCRRNHPPSHVEAVLARSGFGVFPAKTLNEAMMRLPHADAIVISCCWSIEEKHELLDALAAHTTAPFFCLNESHHGCCACTEADRFDPKALVAAIQQRLGIRAMPATSDAPRPAAAAATAKTDDDDQPHPSAQLYNIAAAQPPKPNAASVRPKALAKAAG